MGSMACLKPRPGLRAASLSVRWERRGKLLTLTLRCNSEGFTPRAASGLEVYESRVRGLASRGYLEQKPRVSFLLCPDKPCVPRVAWWMTRVKIPCPSLP